MTVEATDHSVGPITPIDLPVLTLWDYKVAMQGSDDPKPKMGRPPVDSEAVKVRLLRRNLIRLDNWRRRQPDIPSRPEAIRRLTALAIDAEPILQGILQMIEALPADAELAEHTATIRRLLTIVIE